MQNYKSVYFRDLPAETAKKRSITLAFGPRSRAEYGHIKHLSSEEIRLLLGTDSYETLAAAAATEGRSLNSYCLHRLRESIAQAKARGGQLALPRIEPPTQLFSAVTVTFRAGKKEPFQRWYPYLEGYSPEYVHTILKEYAPHAKVVLDPFAGTATTAFAASELGLQSYFCEVNPVMQFIADVKTSVRLLEPEGRKRVTAWLRRLSARIPDRLSRVEPDAALEKSYAEVFRGSQFFDVEVLQSVLRARSLVDDVGSKSRIVGRLLTVAILAGLIPCSLLKRAGDVRYKTQKELAGGLPSLGWYVAERLAEMAQDLESDTPELQTRPMLVCDDAKLLPLMSPLGVDAIITSPPYINGTNYFRNTRLELWFLRCLRSKEDLARYRHRALTAGINNVTVRKSSAPHHPSVREIVEQLKGVAYDSRIPRMVASYFAETSQIFAGARKHLLEGATIAIDIGDSNYAGVHVPADTLLVECLADLGFSLSRTIELRRRKSRNGARLKQVLLVFDFQGQSLGDAKAKYDRGAWKRSWRVFKRTLPHQVKPYSKRNWGHKLHSLCSYPGKLKPAIAHHLVKIFVPEGGSVLDPFAGVGTIPFEAALQGRVSYGFELSPAAYVVASAKLRVPSAAKATELIDELADFLKTQNPTRDELGAARTFGFNRKLNEYFHADTLREVLLARRFFQLISEEAPSVMLVKASLLHILHGNRPYALSRRSHPITPYAPSGDSEYRPLIPRLRDKVRRSLEDPLPAGFVEGTMYFQDSTTSWPVEISDLDAVITSPPFFDSTRFYLANWMRLWFSGWSASDFEHRPGSFVDERQKQGFEIYVPVLRQARERLKPGGVVVLHLGKSMKCDMAARLKEVGERWFRVADVFEESVVHCESHGVRDKGTVTAHQYLLLN